VVGVFVKEPDGGVVRVGHGVGGDEPLPVTLAACDETRHRRRRPEVELQPLVFWASKGKVMLGANPMI
jgi:hypothetical protein